MINYIFKDTTESTSILIVVRANTLTDARALLESEYSDKSTINITLIECCKELAFLN